MMVKEEAKFLLIACAELSGDREKVRELKKIPEANCQTLLINLIGKSLEKQTIENIQNLTVEL
jgi:hypothetical protein